MPDERGKVVVQRQLIQRLLTVRKQPLLELSFVFFTALLCILAKIDFIDANGYPWLFVDVQFDYISDNS
jgi:hypothetical protein